MTDAPNIADRAKITVHPVEAAEGPDFYVDRGPGTWWVLQPKNDPMFTVTRVGRHVRVPWLPVPIRDTNQAQILAAGMTLAFKAVGGLIKQTSSPIQEIRIYYARQSITTVGSELQLLTAVAVVTARD